MNDTHRLTALLDAAGCAYAREEPMRRHTSFQIGGPAELFVTPTLDQLPQILALCRELELPCLVIGNGSNLLVSDEGIRGVVLSLHTPASGIAREGDSLVAAAGTTLSALCVRAQQEGLSGLEFAFGIPGSVGGGVYMNAGAYGCEIKDVITSVCAVNRRGQRREILAQDAGFAYRTSRFQAEDAVVTEARFALAPGSPQDIDSRMQELMARRTDRQPLEFPSAGSTFKRPAGFYAGSLIEQCGLKGRAVGGAQVSEKHAGFVINRGGATCADVVALCRMVHDEVLRRAGVALEPEVRLIGPQGETAWTF